MENTKLIKKLVYTGVMTALVFIATFSIKIPVPFTNGYIHAGDSMVFLSAMLLEMPYAIFAAGVGSMLSDLIGGYVHWMIPTLIIKSLMALILCIVVKRSKKNIKSTILYGSTASIIWFGFLMILRNLMKSNITEKSTDLISEVKVNNINELLSLNAKVQNEILIAAIIIPIIIIILLFAINKKFQSKLLLNQSLGMTIAGLVMIIGYYFTAYILYGNYIVPIFSIPSNLIQFIVGYIIAIFIAPPLMASKLFTKE